MRVLISFQVYGINFKYLFFPSLIASRVKIPIIFKFLKIDNISKSYDDLSVIKKPKLIDKDSKAA